MSLEDLLVNQHYDELYIVMELLDCDLHYVINKSKQPLDDVHHRYFMFQILKGVKVCVCGLSSNLSRACLFSAWCFMEQHIMER